MTAATPCFDASANPDPKLAQFLGVLSDSIQNNQLIRLVLSKYQGDDPDVGRITKYVKMEPYVNTN